jgi:hypothetical protein
MKDLGIEGFRNLGIKTDDRNAFNSSIPNPLNSLIILAY